MASVFCHIMPFTCVLKFFPTFAGIFECCPTMPAPHTCGVRLRRHVAVYGYFLSEPSGYCRYGLPFCKCLPGNRGLLAIEETLRIRLMPGFNPGLV